MELWFKFFLTGLVLIGVGILFVESGEGRKEKERIEMEEFKKIEWIGGTLFLSGIIAAIASMFIAIWK